MRMLLIRQLTSCFAPQRCRENLCLFPLFGAVRGKLSSEPHLYFLTLTGKRNSLLLLLFWLALAADCNELTMAFYEECIVCFKPLMQSS